MTTPEMQFYDTGSEGTDPVLPPAPSARASPDIRTLRPLARERNSERPHSLTKTAVVVMHTAGVEGARRREWPSRGDGRE